MISILVEEKSVILYGEFSMIALSVIKTIEFALGTKSIALPHRLFDLNSSKLHLYSNE